MSQGFTGMEGTTPREILLIAAARAVIAAVRDSRGELRLPVQARATLTLLEGALQPYLDPPPAIDRRK